MKRMKYFILLSVILTFIICPIINAATTLNGVEIEENSGDTFSLYCEWNGPNGGYHINIDRALTEDTGNVEGNAAIFDEASNKTLKTHYFMNEDGSLDCPNYLVTDRPTTKILGFSNHLDLPYNGTKNEYQLRKEKSKCIGKCGNIPDSSNANSENNNGLQTGDLNCKGIFKGDFGKILKQILDIMRFLVPILILGLSVVDFIKALAAQNQDEVKKAFQKFIKRLIIGIIIFLLPTILEFLLNLAGLEYGICELGE